MSAATSRRILVALPTSFQKAFVGVEARRLLAECGHLTWNPENTSLDEQTLSCLLRDVDGAIFGWGDNGLSPGALETAHNLRIIGVIGSSVKKIQAQLALQRGITVVNTAAAVADCTAEHALALILVCVQRIVVFDQGMKAGGFEVGPWNDLAVTRDWPGGGYLLDCEVGIVGLGNVGMRLAELLQPFNVKIRAYSSHVSVAEAARRGIELTGLDELLRCSDVVTLHAGLRPETRDLIGERELSLLRPGAILVNTARGGLVDEEALVDRLRQKQIYAGLDVYREEPLSPDHPLRRLDNVVLTPHTGACHLANYPARLRQRVGLAIARDFRTFFEGGELAHALTPGRVATMGRDSEAVRLKMGSA